MFQHDINQNLSLIMHNVLSRYTHEEKIVQVFHEQHIGKVFKVSFRRMPINKKNKILIYNATIYFSVWYDTPIAYNLQQRILNGMGLARVMYDDPWHWIVFENKSRPRFSKIEKRIMRIAADTYKIQHENEQIQKRNAEIEAENAYMIQQQLAFQNQCIQELQNICIANGLDIPFWNSKNPPSADVSSMEMLSAKTAIASAEFVLNESDKTNAPVTDYTPMTRDTPLSPMGMSDQQDMDYEKEEDFIPVERYKNDDIYDNNNWEDEDPYEYFEEYYQQQIDEANWR
jgi:hypothetical protein